MPERLLAENRAHGHFQGEVFWFRQRRDMVPPQESSSDRLSFSLSLSGWPSRSASAAGSAALSQVRPRAIGSADSDFRVPGLLDSQRHSGSDRESSPRGPGRSKKEGILGLIHGVAVSFIILHPAPFREATGHRIGIASLATF